MENSTDKSKNSKSKTMLFNISEIRQKVGDYRLLTSAELRMLIKKTAIPSEQRVELYRGLGSSARYLASRFVSNKLKDKWLSFDVTDTLRSWLETGGEQRWCIYLSPSSMLMICTFTCKGAEHTSCMFLSHQGMNRVSSCVCSVDAARMNPVVKPASVLKSLGSKMAGETTRC